MKSAAITVLLLLSLLSSSNADCPSNKRCRKLQIAKLPTLTSNQVAVEATYFGKSNNVYRFVVDRAWKKNHGSLKTLDRINVTVSDDTIRDCYDNMRPSEKYIIMVEPLKDGYHQYRAIEVPVSSRRKRHRKLVREELCNGEEDGVCALSITMSPNTPNAIFYRGSMKLIRCRVETISDVATVTWYKDGIDLDNEIYRELVVLIKDDPENSYVIIVQANRVHNGNYKCEVRTTNGQTAEASTNVIVLGPEEESHFTDCKEPNYCLHGGTCRQYLSDLSVKPICQCKTGRDGERCEHLVDDITPSSTEDQEEFDNMKENVQQLTIAVIGVTVALVLLLLVSVCYIARLRRHLDSSKDQYDVVSQSRLSIPQSDINATRYTNTGSDVVSGRLLVTDSRRSSVKSFGKTPTIFVSHENEKLTNSPQQYEHNSNLVTKDISRHSSSASDKFSKRSRLSASS